MTDAPLGPQAVPAAARGGRSFASIREGLEGAWRAMGRIPGARSPYVAAGLTLGAVAIALLTQFAVTSEDGFGRAGYTFFLACLIFGAGAFVAARARQAGAEGMPIVLSRPVELVLLAAVMGLAIFFRTYRFYDFPPGLWYDEAINGIDAFSIIDKDHLTVWRETNFGHSTIYFYLLIASFKLFGYTLFAMRIVAVLAGIAAVFAFYFLARWLLGVVPALVATALLACSRYATTFSRITWEASLEPLLEIMAVFFFVRGLETRRNFYFFMAGGSLAAGIYTYLAFRIIPFVMLFFLLYVAVSQWQLIKKNIPGLVVYALSFIVIVTPLAQYALQNQDRFLARTRDVNVFKEIDEKDSYEPLRSNIEKSIKLMNVAGDRNGRHNLPGAPMVDDVTAALFVLGVAVSVWSVRDWRKGSVLGWLALALVPGIFTISIENPSMIRGVGAIPPVYLLAGLAVAQAYRGLNATRAGQGAFVVLAAALIVGATTLNYRDFFERQLNNEQVYNDFQPWFTDIGEIAARDAGDKQVYINEEYRGHPAIRVLTRGETHHPYRPTRELILDARKGDAVLIPTTKQFGIIPVLQKLYPNMERKDFVDPFGRAWFSELQIPASDMEALNKLQLTVYRGREASGTPVLTERAPVQREWNEDDLQDGPLTAVWEGLIWVPTYPGFVTITGSSPGVTAVEIEGAPVLIADKQAFSLQTRVAFGERKIRVVAIIDRPGLTTFQYAADGTESVPLAQVVYNTSLGEQGFQAIFRSGAEFTTPPEVIGHVPFAVAVGIAPDLQAAEYRGMFDASSDGDYAFALDGISSAQLFIDDQLVVDNGGNHGSRRVEAEVPLSRGEHLMSIRYIAGGLPDWSIHARPPFGAWRQLDGSEVTVPVGPYVPPALATLRPDPSWGAFGRPIEGLGEPNAMAVRPDGTVLVGYGNKISFIEARTGAESRTIEVPVEELSDIALAPDGSIVVLDTVKKTIVILDANGAETGRLPDNAFSSAAGLTVSGDAAYVASPAGGLIYRVTLDPLSAEILIGRGGVAPGVERALQPCDVVVGDDGTLYANDFERKRIVAYRNGQSIRGSSGVTGTARQLPHMAYYNKLLIVSDPQNTRIVVYDVGGKLRGVYAFPPAERIARPIGIAVGDDGSVYVATSERGAVFKFKLEISERLAAELAALP